jgi:excisionase family DNA binding protein
MDDTTMSVKEAAEFMRLGDEALKQLIDDGRIEAVRLNQKHTVLLRSVVIQYLRDEGKKQALDRRARRERPMGRDRRPRRAPAPNLDGYERAGLTTGAAPESKRAGSRNV